jgi:hypothetical protein
VRVQPKEILRARCICMDRRLKHLSKVARRVVRALKNSVLDREVYYPNRTAEEFKDLLPNAKYDEYWTREQQAELVARFKAGPGFEKLLSVTLYIVSVWKTAFRFTGRLATDIIGPKINLEFKSDSHSGDRHAWTQRFHEALTDVILHPMFNLDTRKMALVIQWACHLPYGRQEEI